MARVNAIGTEFVEGDVDDIVPTHTAQHFKQVLMTASNPKYPSDSSTKNHHIRSYRMASIPNRTIIPSPQIKG